MRETPHFRHAPEGTSVGCFDSCVSTVFGLMLSLDAISDNRKPCPNNSRTPFLVGIVEQPASQLRRFWGEPALEEDARGTLD
jgi:hypothetical protein